jgi:hypothetical protein
VVLTSGHDEGGDEAEAANPLSEYRKRLLSLTSASRLGKFKSLVESVVDLEAAPREFLVRERGEGEGRERETNVDVRRRG